MTIITPNQRLNNASERVATDALPFPNVTVGSAELAFHRERISHSYRVVMAVLAQANAPDRVRNFIDALINLSGGEFRVEASDYKVGAAFYKDEESRNTLKKRVQAWRKCLRDWQEASDYTLVQISSGFKTLDNKNQPSVYRLLVLEMAAAVLAEGEADVDKAARSVLGVARGIPSKVEMARRRPKFTSERCRRMALTWLGKSFDMARAEGRLDDLISDLTESLAVILSEFKTESAGEPNSARLSQGEWELGIINTYSTPPTITNDGVVSEESYDGTGEVPCVELPAIQFPASEHVSVTAESAPQLTMLDHALAHARHGFRVFPVHTMRKDGCSCLTLKEEGDMCHATAKHPRIREWNRLATTDEATIRKWWQRFPKSNVGIATGCGVLVLDVDSHKGGDASLSALEAEHGALPVTLTARTGGGGRHILFKTPAGVRVSNIQASLKLGRGLDVRGDGGFIVASGSVHASGNRYEWVAEAAAIAEAPEWLLEKLAAPVSTGAARVEDGSRPSTPPVRRAGGGYDPVPEGLRNDFLFGKAIGLVRSHDVSQTLDRVRWWNERCCVPPVNIAEMQKLVWSAERVYLRERDRLLLVPSNNSST